MSEMAEHRVSMLGASWRRYQDPTRSRDPRVRAVVEALAALPSPDPRPEFRAGLRAQLVALAPRIIAESADSAEAPTRAAPSGASPRHTDSVLARFRGVRLGRPLAVAAAVVTAVALLFGGAVWMSQRALPGDTLYGLKRASESWQLATASGPIDKARDYLKFATTRVDEAQQLASRASASAAGLGPQAGRLDAHTASLIRSTLASADHDVTSASSLLGEQAVDKHSTSPLEVLPSWAPGQLTRLTDLAAGLPDTDLRGRAQASADLVTAAVERARDLAAEIGSGCLEQAGTDSLGPLPEGSCSSSSPSPPTTSRQHGSAPHHPSTSQTSGPSGRAGGEGAATAAEPTTTAPAPGGTTSGSPSSTGLIKAPPVLGGGSSSSGGPVTIDSCGIGVSLGPIGIGVGTCGG
jgi:hypothetical protein